MRITFVLPHAGTKPSGGFKVVYEYANGLTVWGHTVTVVHTAIAHMGMSRLQKGKRLVRHLINRAQGYGPHRWFNLLPQVRVIGAPSLHESFIPDGDIVVATAWQTAEWVAGYGSRKGKKLYLIQHKETWSGPEERVMTTWKSPLRKIVIARWLEHIAHDMGEEATYIPNGLDFEAFGVDTPSKARDPHQVMMLYHLSKWKGSKDGLEALRQVKEQVPELHATLFGVPEASAGLPSWITYRQNPPQLELRRLYNEAAIFVAPSWTEGWPLPPAEALMSGAALAATNIGGHQEYAEHESTALISPPHDPTALATNILRLIKEQNLRWHLAEAGHSYIQRFTWDKAVTSFERVAGKACDEGD